MGTSKAKSQVTRRVQHIYVALSAEQLDWITEMSKTLECTVSSAIRRVVQRQMVGSSAGKYAYLRQTAEGGGDAETKTNV